MERSAGDEPASQAVERSADDGGGDGDGAGELPSDQRAHGKQSTPSAIYDGLARNVQALDVEALDDDALAAELAGMLDDEEDLTTPRFVRSAEERNAAEEVAQREPCEDFWKYSALFDAVREDLKTGVRLSPRYQEDAAVEQGDLFIVGGQIAYVAEKGEEFPTAFGKRDARLRVVFDNRTQSGLLMRSLQRALNRDPAGRRVVLPDQGPLFSGEWAPGDERSGTIYVVRSNSTLPTIAQNRSVIHKIGVTRGNPATRLANASKDPTFLLAGVEVVATYDLVNIDGRAFEKLVHRILAPAQLDISIPDRFGNLVHPREWFWVPLSAVDEIVARISDGTITRYVYEPSEARLVLR